MSGRTGHLEIWVCASTGADCAPLTSARAPEVGSPKWSPDGRQIAFDLDQKGHYEIYTVNVDGGLPRRLTTATSHQVRPNWSVDGRSIYFASDRQDGWQIWNMPASNHHADKFEYATSQTGAAGIRSTGAITEIHACPNADTSNHRQNG